MMPLLGEPELFAQMIELLFERTSEIEYDRILGIESRGFLIGPLLAQRAARAFVPIRKKGKLPGDVYSAEYELEYGRDVLEVQKNALPKNSKCLIVDDLIATGGSMAATKKLVTLSGSQVAGFTCVIELSALEGRKKLGDCPLISLFSY